MKMLRLIWLLPILFCCCHKSNNNSNNKTSGFTYSTTYDSVITTYANKSLPFSFTVNVLTGSITGNTLTYSISGLPAGVTAAPASIQVNGQLGGLFNITVDSIAAGNYPLSLVSSCTATGTRNQNLVLKVLAMPDYTLLLSGTYPNSHNYCQPRDTLYSFSSVVSAVTGTPYSINISNLRIFDTSLQITAMLSDVVKVPYQVHGSYAIWGSGNYTHDNPPNSSLYMLTLYDTTVHGTDTEACLIHIQH